ncbi:MAG: bifunctional 5,10-methylene-tetrahydrofolate dehydrogenase/5,10-methylene-tetrahydrofolate cyclohydrolase, partial [Clostridiales bacterium]|nr:bifunctional 5,10-methylene-tetrahydrofolate dehydrogenase/5,10-methylene-tetrahydrofolate cyclohydrolase [Clostridiales bacterium]
MSNIIDGKSISAKVKEEVAKGVKSLTKKGINAGLAVVIVGDNQASRVYVNSKKKACAECGIASYEYALGEGTSEEELLNLVAKLNEDDKVSGILVQLPLPKHINEERIIEAISPKKDVDAFHAVNV